MKEIKIFYDVKYRPKTRKFITAIMLSSRKAGLRANLITEYKPFEGLFVCYGCGRPDLTRLLERHVQSGNRVVNIDMGYWGKGFRLSVDGLHPNFLPESSPDRFDNQHIPLTNCYDPAGPIILVGLGPKSRHLGTTWEEEKLVEIRQILPGRKVIYRPKPNRPFPVLPVDTNCETPIEELLNGASLVVTRHSNVGVDACFQGIPVCTETGVAALLYGNDLLNPSNPSEQDRKDFLRKLAWWNWTFAEAQGTCIWNWLKFAIPLIPSTTGLSSER